MLKPKQRLCDLSRTTLLELSEGGLIRTVAIRKPGAVKGIRLVHMPSLLEYLEAWLRRTLFKMAIIEKT
jgi:hypothetical protein